jgi:hypothetical protein
MPHAHRRRVERDFEAAHRMGERWRHLDYQISPRSKESNYNGRYDTLWWPGVDYKFEDKGKFALLAFSTYVDLPETIFRLSDGTWVMRGVPVPDLGVWKDWIGSIHTDRLKETNFVLFVEEPSDSPEILDDVHQHLADDLCRLFFLMHLQSDLQCEQPDLLCGSSEHGMPDIRQMRRLPIFYQSKGSRREPITKEWLEDAVMHRAGMMAMELNQAKFRRVIRGLNILLNGLQQRHGQDRLHQFVRSLEALILPDIRKTRSQFAHRCQTFARPNNETHNLLLEIYDMRCDTEHVHSWDRTVQHHPADRREDVCWQRTRQIEHLACNVYSRLLRNPALWHYFQTDDMLAAFWKMRDDQQRALWGKPLDIAQEPLVQNYNQWGSAVAWR